MNDPRRSSFRWRQRQRDRELSPAMRQLVEVVARAAYEQLRDAPAPVDLPPAPPAA